MSIQIFYFVDASVQDGIIVCGANWYIVGVLKSFSDSRKLRPVIISWERYLHIQIRVVEHAWSAILGIRNCVVVIDLQKFFFEVFVVVYVIGPIIRIGFITNIVPSNGLQLPRNHGFKLIKYIYSARRTYLEFRDALYGGAQHHVSVLT